MEMVQQRKQGSQNQGQGASSSRCHTWEDVAAMYHVDNPRVSKTIIIRHHQWAASSQTQPPCMLRSYFCLFIRCLSPSWWYPTGKLYSLQLACNAILTLKCSCKIDTSDMPGQCRSKLKILWAA